MVGFMVALKRALPTARMLDLGRAKFQKGPPKISYQLPYLVIESEEETRMRLRVDR